jgi:DNA-binding XRE family transcriptional regulator
MLGVKRQSGAALRGWRYDRNITQVQLAAAWGVSKRSIIRWEQRDALPVLVKLALEG